MYNISLYPFACKQRWVFNILVTHIPTIFKFHAFGKLHFYSIHVGLRVNCTHHSGINIHIKQKGQCDIFT